MTNSSVEYIDSEEQQEQTLLLIRTLMFKFDEFNLAMVTIKKQPSFLFRSLFLGFLLLPGN